MLPGFDGLMLNPPFWNGADKTAGTALSNSDQTATCPQNNGVRSLLSVASGSWYVEIKLNANGTAAMFGVANATHLVSAYPGNDTDSVGYNSNGTGFINYNASNTSVSAGAIAAGDVIGIHVLFGTGVRFTKNNTVIGSGYYTIPPGPLMAMVFQANVAGTSQFTVNQAPQYAMPGGASYWPI